MTDPIRNRKLKAVNEFIPGNLEASGALTRADVNKMSEILKSKDLINHIQNKYAIQFPSVPKLVNSYPNGAQIFTSTRNEKEFVSLIVFPNFKNSEGEPFTYFSLDGEIFDSFESEPFSTWQDLLSLSNPSIVWLRLTKGRPPYNFDQPSHISLSGNQFYRNPFVDYNSNPPTTSDALRLIIQGFEKKNYPVKIYANKDNVVTRISVDGILFTKKEGFNTIFTSLDREYTLVGPYPGTRSFSDICNSSLESSDGSHKIPLNGNHPPFPNSKSNQELAKAMVSPIRCGGLDYPRNDSNSFPIEIHAEFPISKKFSDSGAILTYAPFGISQIFFPDLNLTFTSSNGINFTGGPNPNNPFILSKNSLHSPKERARYNLDGSYVARRSNSIVYSYPSFVPNVRTEFFCRAGCEIPHSFKNKGITYIHLYNTEYQSSNGSKVTLNWKDRFFQWATIDNVPVDIHPSIQKPQPKFIESHEDSTPEHLKKPETPELFTAWLIDRKNKVPTHSGIDIPGVEKALNYFNDIDQEIIQTLNKNHASFQTPSLVKEIAEFIREKRRLSARLELLKKQESLMTFTRPSKPAEPTSQEEFDKLYPSKEKSVTITPKSFPGSYSSFSTPNYHFAKYPDGSSLFSTNSGNSLSISFDNFPSILKFNNQTITNFKPCNPFPFLDLPTFAFNSKEISLSSQRFLAFNDSEVNIIEPLSKELDLFKVTNFNGYQYFYNDKGQRHNPFGPAVIIEPTSPLYYLNDTILSKEEWEAKEPWNQIKSDSEILNPSHLLNSINWSSKTGIPQPSSLSFGSKSFTIDPNMSLKGGCPFWMPAIPLPRQPLKDLPSIYSASIFNLLDDSKSPAPESLVIWQGHAYILRDNTITQLLLPNASYSFDPKSMTLHGPCQESSSAPVRFFWQGKECKETSFIQMKQIVENDRIRFEKEIAEDERIRLEKKTDEFIQRIADGLSNDVFNDVGQTPPDLLSLDKDVEIIQKRIFEALKVPPDLLIPSTPQPLPSPQTSITSGDKNLPRTPFGCTNFDNRSIFRNPDNSILISYPPNKNAFSPSGLLDPNYPTALSLDPSGIPTKLTINYSLSIHYLPNDNYPFTQFTPAPSFPSFPFPTYQLNTYYFVAISPQNEVYVITNSPSSNDFHVTRLDGLSETYNSQGQLHSITRAASQFPYGKNLSYFLNGIPLTKNEWEIESNIIKEELKAAEKILPPIIDSDTQSQSIPQELPSQEPSPKSSILARSLISSIPTIPSALLSLFPSQFSKELRVNALSKSLSSSLNVLTAYQAPPPASSRISLINDKSNDLPQIVDYVDLLNSPQSSNSST